MENYVHEVNGAKFFVTVQNTQALYIVFNVCIMFTAPISEVHYVPLRMCL